MAIKTDLLATISDLSQQRRYKPIGTEGDTPKYEAVKVHVLTLDIHEDQQIGILDSDLVGRKVLVTFVD
jgi:hypothetical protein